MLPDRFSSLMTISRETLDELKRRARDATAHAYAPYSRFPVGAAVLADGAMHSAANVENASYGLSVCAERNAIFQAVSHGARRIEAICIHTPTGAPVTPCGACLQVIREFAPDALIVCCTDDDAAERRYRLSELLPAAFRLP
ncbi:MAG TPA: cytidine deaminase [Caldimonas sp.]|nr:cytidine deaminase [Caldimonas sp.]